MTLSFLARYFLMGAILMSLAAFTAPDSRAEPSDVPRFMSLSASKVNMRVGPGKRYPILWVFERSGWPVEVIAEYDRWRKVRDVDGTTGWVHKRLLSKRRTIVVTAKRQSLYEDPDTTSSVLLLAEPGVQGRLLDCDGQWCQVDIAGNEGWLKASNFYGVLENEKIR